MHSTASYLANSKYGYDFVVATTLASINSGLKEYLAEIKQPTTYLCSLGDPQGNPTIPISLDDLRKNTGVDPFDIPSGTDYSDPRIATLTKNRFIVGLKLRPEFPHRIKPQGSTLNRGLESSATNVRFNLFCAELQVIQNCPPGGFSGQWSWNVWTQPDDKAWYFGTTVDLKLADLTMELDTPYFKSVTVHTPAASP